MIAYNPRGLELVFPNSAGGNILVLISQRHRSRSGFEFHQIFEFKKPTVLVTGGWHRRMTTTDEFDYLHTRR